MRRGAAEQRGDVAGQVDLRRWAARAGERGPPLHTEERHRVFNVCEESVPSRPHALTPSRPHASNEWTVVVR
ncbi:hypothetical protein B5181_08070 [Streptomyces sp. 4F]|nr:hypothetical protein B5181_08070 [Streptomyces sp. 4F]